MKMRETYAAIADELDMPISTVGKICRALLKKLAAVDYPESDAVLRKYAPKKGK